MHRHLRWIAAIDPAMTPVRLGSARAAHVDPRRFVIDPIRVAPHHLARRVAQVDPLRRHLPARARGISQTDPAIGIVIHDRVHIRREIRRHIGRRLGPRRQRPRLAPDQIAPLRHVVPRRIRLQHHQRGSCPAGGSRILLVGRHRESQVRASHPPERFAEARLRRQLRPQHIRVALRGEPLDRHAREKSRHDHREDDDHDERDDQCRAAVFSRKPHRITPGTPRASRTAAPAAFAAASCDSSTPPASPALTPSPSSAP